MAGVEVVARCQIPGGGIVLCSHGDGGSGVVRHTTGAIDCLPQRRQRGPLPRGGRRDVQADAGGGAV